MCITYVCLSRVLGHNAAAKVMYSLTYMPSFQKAHVEWPGGLESAFRKMELHAEHKFLPSKFFTLLSISHPVTTFIFSKI